MKADVKITKEGIEKPPKDRLIDAASRLFCRHGINATGIDAVLKEAGTAKMTLYKLFGSKDRLVEAVLEEEGRKWRDWFLTALDAGADPPRRKLDKSSPCCVGGLRRKNFMAAPSSMRSASMTRGMIGCGR